MKPDDQAQRSDGQERVVNGDLARRAREAMRLGVDELADDSGVDPSRIDLLERSDPRTPDVVVQRVARSLGIDPGTLVAGLAAPEPVARTPLAARRWRGWTIDDPRSVVDPAADPDAVRFRPMWPVLVLFACLGAGPAGAAAIHLADRDPKAAFGFALLALAFVAFGVVARVRARVWACRNGIYAVPVAGRARALPWSDVNRIGRAAMPYPLRLKLWALGARHTAYWLRDDVRSRTIGDVLNRGILDSSDGTIGQGVPFVDEAALLDAVQERFTTWQATTRQSSSGSAP